jgi:hypothetical protein
MNTKQFHKCVRDAFIKESSEKITVVKEVITKKSLKKILKETIRTILREMPKKKKNGEIDEMTTTSAVEPINLPGNVKPGWVSKQGGSMRGIQGSRSLGYELTPLGKKQFNQEKQDPVK